MKKYHVFMLVVGDRKTWIYRADDSDRLYYCDGVYVTKKTIKQAGAIIHCETIITSDVRETQLACRDYINAAQAELKATRGE